MTMQRTFSIIKPDAVKRNLIGEINRRIEGKGLNIIGMKMIQLTEEQVLSFYAEHKDRDFFPPLKEFMLSGPIVVQVLEGENAITTYRALMGSTNPDEAQTGTIRKDFALNMRENSTHGSDSEESAKREIRFFFSENDLHSR